jgi:hypothetical protein
MFITWYYKRYLQKLYFFSLSSHTLCGQYGWVTDKTDAEDIDKKKALYYYELGCKNGIII